MRPTLTVLALAGLALEAAHAPAAPPPDFAQLMSLLAQRRHGHVRYTEVHEIAALRAPLTSTGELLYDAPARLEKRTLTPRAETLVLDQGVLSARRGNRTHELALADYPQAIPFVESIRATLAGDAGALEHYFHVRFTGALAHWSLELTPRDPTLAQTVTDVRLAGEGEAIRTVVINERDGDRSLISIGPEIEP